MADQEEGEKAKSTTLNERKQRRQEWWSKKRQRSRDNKVELNQETRKRKKRKQTELSNEKGNSEKEDSSNLRYILFVGNLSYECTEDNLRDHFGLSGALKDVRVLTKKDTGKSKGCAFLEFESRMSQMKALKLHHSTLCGRKINVELTCGGGGKGEQRMVKLKSKVDKMKEKRKKAKLKKKKKSEDLTVLTSGT